jgi:glucokinase
LVEHFDADGARMTTNGPVALAIDVGGTKVAAGIVDARGHIHAQATIPTQRARPTKDEGRRTEDHGHSSPVLRPSSAGDLASPATSLLARIAGLATQVMAQTEKTLPPPIAAGVATTGHVDARQGVILHSGLVPGWSGLPLVSHLTELLHLPVHVRNDGHALAVAEHRLGAARGFDHVLCVAVGTGVGGGLIEDGHLLLGARGLAGLIGHTTIAFDGRRCQCGKIGCLEAYAAGPRIVDEYHRLRRSPHPQGALAEPDLLGSQPATLQELADLANGGDPLAIDALERGGAYLGAGLASLANAFNPQLVVVGGGVLGAGSHWFDAVRRTTLERARHTIAEGLQVVPAALGPQAVLVGAGLIALDA